MRAKDYAGAVISLSKKGESDAKIISALVKELQLRGETKLLPRILGELKRGLMRQTILAPRVEVAHKKDEAVALKAAKAEGIEVESATLNPHLVSGWRAFSAGKLVDRSGKNVLINLYRSVTR